MRPLPPRGLREAQEETLHASLRLRIRRGELPRECLDAEAARASREPDELFSPLDGVLPLDDKPALDGPA